MVFDLPLINCWRGLIICFILLDIVLLSFKNAVLTDNL